MNREGYDGSWDEEAFDKLGYRFLVMSLSSSMFKLSGREY